MKQNYKISMYYDDYITHHENIIATDLHSESNSIIFNTNKETITYLDVNDVKYNIERNFKEKFKQILLLKRFVLVSLIIIMFGLYINTYRIQNIIFNIDTPINDEIKQKIEQSTKKVFFFNFSSLDYQELSKELRSEYSCYEWISVTKNYDVIEVEIIKTGLDNNYIPEINGNIVATKDGIIESYIVTSGDVLIQRNDYVKQGDILIQGSYYDVTMGARGVVLAHTYETLTFQVDKVVNTKELSGNVDSFYQIDIFNNLFDLKSNYIYNEYEEESKEVFKIPFLFSVNKMYQYEKEDYTYYYDLDSAIEYGYTKVEEDFYLNQHLDDELIENCMLLSSEEYDSYYEVTYLVKKLESIGTFEEMIQ